MEYLRTGPAITVAGATLIPIVRSTTATAGNGAWVYGAVTPVAVAVVTFERVVVWRTDGRREYPAYWLSAVPGLEALVAQAQQAAR